MPLRFVIAIAETPTTMPHTGDKFIQGAITHCYTGSQLAFGMALIKLSLRNHGPINALNQHANKQPEIMKYN